MNPIQYAWLIPLLPVLGFLINIILGYKLGKKLSVYLSVIFMLVSTILAVILLAQTWQAAPSWDRGKLYEIIEAEKDIAHLQKSVQKAEQAGVSSARVAEIRTESEQIEHSLHVLEEEAKTRHSTENFPFTSNHPWLTITGEEGFPIGLFIDSFAAVMVFMVAFVCLLIHLFSVEYMANEERYPTFFAYISIFSAAMLAMVLSRNLFHVLLFWEVMGVMSYLLIGFFYKKIAAQQAMKKAFLVTKVADIGLMIGLFWIYHTFGTLDLISLQELAPEVLIALPSVATGIGLLLFIGAMGKSAQFPLHVWLLDAMEGPTPVSAMIHAATMVAAGVYLLARTYPIITTGNSLEIIAIVGAVTALFAASLAPFFTDIKKILAWSTVSQLGFMFIGLGAFGWVAAIFHLLTHAFFKALLFLCAGSMIHGSGTQDIFKMNRLAKYMPSTRLTFIIGGLSLAGIFPLAGFWSKDEILLAVQHATSHHTIYSIILVMAYLASFLTAFYISRAYLIAFEQPKQTSIWQEDLTLPELNMSAENAEHDQKFNKEHLHDPPHESGWHISTALWILAGSATLVGLLGSPILGNVLQLFVYEGTIPHLEPIGAQLFGFFLSTIIAVAGIGFAAHLSSKTLRIPNWLMHLFQRRFYIDKIYYAIFANPLTKLAKPVAWFDGQILDGFIDFMAWFVGTIGGILRKIQTGRLEHYTYTIVVAALILIVAFSVGLF